MNHMAIYIMTVLIKSYTKKVIYPLKSEAMFVLLLADDLHLEAVEFDGLLVKFIHSVHHTSQLSFKNRTGNGA